MSKKKSNGKKIVFGILAIIMLAFLGIGGYIFHSLTTSKTIDGFLMNVEGEVFVTRNSNRVEGFDDLEVHKESIIETRSGTATLVLRESIFIDIDENTEIVVAELSNKNVKVKQHSGSAWSKFTRILGVEEYEVEVPNAVATVRGTQFRVNVDDDYSSVMVSEGNLIYADENDELPITEFQKAEKRGSENIAEAELDDDDVKDIIRNVKRAIINLRQLRSNEIRKHQRIAKQLIEMNNIDVSQISEHLNYLDVGGFDEEEIKSYIPVKVESIDIVFAITNDIQKELERFERLKNQYPEIASEVERELRDRFERSNELRFLVE